MVSTAEAEDARRRAARRRQRLLHRPVQQPFLFGMGATLTQSEANMPSMVSALASVFTPSGGVSRSP